MPRSIRTRTSTRRAALLTSGAALLLLSVPGAPADAADVQRVEIVNAYSGLRADVMWGSADAYQGVFLWRDNSSASQEFDLLDSGDGYFRIRARHSGQCLMLEWRDGNYRNGTPVIQYPACDAGYSPAEWSIGVLSGTRCEGNICSTGIDETVLVNRRTGRCLDAGNAAGGAPPEQTVLQTWDCVGSTDDWNIGNQSWDVMPPGAHRID